MVGRGWNKTWDCVTKAPRRAHSHPWRGQGAHPEDSNVPVPRAGGQGVVTQPKGCRTLPQGCPWLWLGRAPKVTPGTPKVTPDTPSPFL